MIVWAAESTLPQPSLMSGVKALTCGFSYAPTERKRREGWGSDSIYIVHYCTLAYFSTPKTFFFSS